MAIINATLQKPSCKKLGLPRSCLEKRKNAEAKQRQCPTTMVVILIMFSLLLLVPIVLALGLIFRGKSGNIISGIPNQGLNYRLRYREGGVSYTRTDGVQGRIRVENPYESHSARYERRHHHKKHTPTKPWAQ
jgi:hypothetical protein